jgi:serine/threonine protein kinase/Tfp pilus assembly protein PilF
MSSFFGLRTSFVIRHSDFVILPMTPARFQTIEEIFRAALDQEPDHLSVFLDTACNGDEVLRRNVETLLSSRPRADNFMEESAVGLAAKIIQNGQADSLVGETIGHYKISESIGTGGMGEVYLATDIVAGRNAALKLLPLRFTGDAERLKRFQQEAHAVVGLNHPNILTVYEIGQDHSIHFIASELIEGETLRQRLTRGPLQLREAIDVAIQVASALAAAHQAGIVHRDIKPENIMLRPDGYVKVLDFGIAKLAEPAFAEATADCAGSMRLAETNLGSILGTVRYMSPEQACPAGRGIDKRTDIWSLGVVLYEMVTGHVPFSRETPKEVLSSILEKEPPPLTRYVARAPVELQQIVSKTLRKDRAQRYHSADELLHALKELRQKLEFKLQRAAAPLWLRWVQSPVALVLMLLATTLALALSFDWHRKLPTTLPPEKSIAVLPFENLSKDEENAFFAGGMQDEILTDLAKIAHLKVISRASVMKYKPGPEQNLREIANTLGVSHVVEGTVQRVGERVRVNVQLIDARNDAHLWAEHYDRDVADVFAIQSAIAHQIAEQLQAKLSPSEKAAIAERPTADLAAYALYTKAKEIDIYENWEGAEKSANQKVELLEKAVQRDPNFALAYCALAKTQTWLDGYSPSSGTGQHLELAKKAAEAALRVRPDLGEAHLELARYYFYAAIVTDPNDFDRARDELTIARRTLPNNSEAFLIAAKIDRHQNRWDSAVTNLRKATELDPRNAEAEYWLETTYFEMRRYSEHEQLVTKDAEGGNPWTQSALARIKLAQGDPVAAQSFLGQVPLDFSPTEEIWGTRFEAALYLRDYDSASRVIAATSGKWGGDAVAEGELARARGDKQKALAAFAAAREKLDATWGDRPKDEVDYMRQVSAIDAGLGRKDQAIREAQRAVDLKPIAKDPLERTYSFVNLALVYAWTGERGRALEQLEIVAAIPAGPTYGDLLLNPCWDDLRGNKRFDKIVAAAKAASK